MFIALDGGDGSGKSTFVGLLVDELNFRHIDHVVVQQPGSTKVGLAIRKIIKDPNMEIDAVGERLLFAADNAACINQLIEPALAAGKLVISDRFSFVTDCAYGQAAGVSFDVIMKIHELLPFIMADLLIIFKCPWETAKDRCVLPRGTAYLPDSDPWRKGCRIEARGSEYMAKVTAYYDSLRSCVTCTSDPNRKMLVPKNIQDVAEKHARRTAAIDASRDFKEVNKDVFSVIGETIKGF